jgi:hypothetical protein
MSEEKSGSHTTFESLAKAFLTFFQLPIRHDNGLELLSNFKQTSATHIADHIHEWRRRRSLCKAETTKQQCLDWFLRSLIALLGKDVTSTFPQSEEEAISKAQQYDLIYAHSGYLYTVLPALPKPVPFGQDKPGMSHSADGLIGATTHHGYGVNHKNPRKGKKKQKVPKIKYSHSDDATHEITKQEKVVNPYTKGYVRDDKFLHGRRSISST